MKLYLKYMVSVRCKMAVQDKLDKLGLYHGTVDLGELVFKKDITPQQLDKLKDELQQLGVELLDQNQGKIIERIKEVILKMVHHADNMPKIKNSEHISQQLNLDYRYLSTLFSEATGVTIEQSIINHRVERVKELLLYDELTLTPTFFKQLKHKMRHL